MYDSVVIASFVIRGCTEWSWVRR